MRCKDAFSYRYANTCKEKTIGQRFEQEEKQTRDTHRPGPGKCWGLASALLSSNHTSVPHPQHPTSWQFCFTHCQIVSLSLWLYGLSTWRVPRRHVCPGSRGEYGNADSMVITPPVRVDQGFIQSFLLP